MKHLLAASALVVTCVAIAQVPQPRSTFTTGDPALRLVTRADSYEKGSYAEWRGSLTLRGVLIVDLHRPEDGESAAKFGAGEVAFRPDRASLRKLPQAVGTHYPKQPAEIWVQDVEPVDVLSRLLGARRAYELTVSTTPRFEFQVELELVQFGTSIDCDHRNFALKARSIRLQRPDLVARSEGSNGGC
jgi:hypothetical protein